MVVTDEVLAPLHRCIMDLERRVTNQSHVVDGLLASGGDPSEATRTLLHLESALRISREHLAILLSARARWYPPERASFAPAV